MGEQTATLSGEGFFFDNLVSTPRMQPYLDEARGDQKAARALYLWAEELAAAAFELLAHFEVGFRNAIDRELATIFETPGKVPWLLSRSSLLGDEIREVVEDTRDSLPSEHRDLRGQIIANLHFGFWTRMLGTKHDELWREGLSKAFPRAVSRKDLSATVEGIRNFRNRIAHHDSVLELDVTFEAERIFQAARSIAPLFEEFLRKIDRLTPLARKRPTEPQDTVLVPGFQEWELYTKTGVYLCQPGRTFRPVKWIAFYVDRTVKEELPFIKERRDNVPFTTDEIKRLKGEKTPESRKIAKAIEHLLEHGWAQNSNSPKKREVGGRYQVFVLTSDEEVQPHGLHKRLAVEIRNYESGKGSAWVTKQRYLYSDRLINEGADYLQSERDTTAS